MQNGKDIKNEWVSFINTGSDQAFHVLYSHYHDYLIYVALRKGASIDQAKDCVNDLFLYVFENRSRLAHIASHHNYLVTCFLRKLFRKERFTISESLSGNAENIPDEPVYRAINISCQGLDGEEQLARILQSYINNLSQSQAKMIYQKFYLGLSYEEMAKANGVSVKTVYNTILRAVARLKGLIGAERISALKATVFSLSSLFIFLAGASSLPLF